MLIADYTDLLGKKSMAIDARQSKRGKRISLQQEKRAAQEIGGRTMAASGATRLGGGGDVRVLGRIRLECKFTEKSSYVLKYEELKKIRRQAMKVLESPVFQFAFRHTTGRLQAYAVIPWDTSTGPPKETTHNWFTSAASVTLTEDQLEKALTIGRIQFTFVHASSDPLAFRLFEIMRWHDYIDKMEAANAGTQYDSPVHGSPDSVKG